MNTTTEYQVPTFLPKKRARNQHPGINSLDDLRAKCDINGEGCWIWPGAKSKDGAAHVWGFHPRMCRMTTMVGGRAAWYLAGREVPDGHIVYRPKCKHSDCVNIEHWACATKMQAHSKPKPEKVKHIDPRTWEEIDGKRPVVAASFGHRLLRIWEGPNAPPSSIFDLAARMAA